MEDAPEFDGFGHTEGVGGGAMLIRDDVGVVAVPTVDLAGGATGDDGVDQDDVVGALPCFHEGQTVARVIERVDTQRAEALRDAQTGGVVTAVLGAAADNTGSHGHVRSIVTRRK